MEMDVIVKKKKKRKNNDIVANDSTAIKMRKIG